MSEHEGPEPLYQQLRDTAQVMDEITGVSQWRNPVIDASEAACLDLGDEAAGRLAAVPGAAAIVEQYREMSKHFEIWRLAQQEYVAAEGREEGSAHHEVESTMRASRRHLNAHTRASSC